MLEAEPGPGIVRGGSADEQDYPARSRAADADAVNAEPLEAPSPREPLAQYYPVQHHYPVQHRLARHSLAPVPGPP